MSDDFEQASSLLAEAVARVCEFDWPGWDRLDSPGQLEQHRALTAILCGGLAGFDEAARRGHAPDGPRAEVFVQRSWWKLEDATASVRFAPLTHPRHWRSTLERAFVDFRYTAAHYHDPDAPCDCALAVAHELPARGPNTDQLIEIGRGEEKDLPWEGPYVDYECSSCGARWRSQDTSSATVSATTWFRLRP